MWRGQWKRLHTRMLANEAAMPMFPKHRFTFRRMFSFVAVVLVLVCLSVAILYRNVHTGMEVSYFVNETPLGDKTRLLLADGSSVWLNSGVYLEVFYRLQCEKPCGRAGWGKDISK